MKKTRPHRSIKSAGSLFGDLSSHTIKLLNYLLPIILLEFIWLAIAFYSDISADPIYALGYYPIIIEHLMMSLLLTIGGAVLFDISIKEYRK